MHRGLVCTLRMQTRGIKRMPLGPGPGRPIQFVSASEMPYPLSAPRGGRPSQKKQHGADSVYARQTPPAHDLPRTRFSWKGGPAGCPSSVRRYSVSSACPLRSASWVGSIPNRSFCSAQPASSTRNRTTPGRAVQKRSIFQAFYSNFLFSKL